MKNVDEEKEIREKVAEAIFEDLINMKCKRGTCGLCSNCKTDLIVMLVLLSV